MRRVFIFAALLSLLGLSTAFAASFSVQSEDIASFTTDVSISVPTTVATSERTYYLGGAESALPGTLSTTPENQASNVRSASIDPGTSTVQSQTVSGRYHSWQTTQAPNPIVLAGPASLLVTRNGAGEDLAAALFRCPVTATPTSVACTRIAGDTAGVPGPGSNEVVVNFGSVNATIPVGETLRVQIMNPDDKKWNVQWGYKANRPSALSVTVIGT